MRTIRSHTSEMHMRAAFWTILTAVFGIATFGAIGAGIQRAQHADTAHAKSAYAFSTGAGDALVWIVFIAILALITRACYRRASQAKGAGQPPLQAGQIPRQAGQPPRKAAQPPNVDKSRRPWER
jgi:hypothetical protein